MAYALVLVPLAFALVALVLPSDRLRPWVVTAAGSAHAVLTVLALREESVSAGRWLFLDSSGKLVLALTSALFLLCSLYVPAYLRQRSDRPNRVLCACLLVFVAMLVLIALSHHL